MDLDSIVKSLSSDDSQSERDGIANAKLKRLQSKRERKPLRKRSYGKRKPKDSQRRTFHIPKLVKGDGFTVKVGTYAFVNRKILTMSDRLFIGLWQRYGPNRIHQLTGISMRAILARRERINDLMREGGRDERLKNWINPNYSKPDAKPVPIYSPVYIVNRRPFLILKQALDYAKLLKTDVWHAGNKVYSFSSVPETPILETFEKEKTKKLDVDVDMFF